jgi:uncharacterized GH25 family protein
MKIAKLAPLILGLVLAGAVFPAAAHEFWVSPRSYHVEPGERIVAALRNGQMMRGAELPYVSSWFHDFSVTVRDHSRDVAGFEGDMPALSYTPAEPGLHVIAYSSTADTVTYDDWNRFQAYLAYEGLDGVAEAHRARGLPEAGFSEDYTRFAKALVQVGPVDEDDGDAPLGLRFELVAENNPYAPGAEAVMVTLLRRGEPVAGRQIAVFRCAGEVTRTLVTTDTRGQAAIPIAGGGVFLLNAVDIRPVERDAPGTEGTDGTGGPVWESDWASLTFGLGAADPACDGSAPPDT